MMPIHSDKLLLYHRLHTLDKIPEFVIWIKANELQKKELLTKVEQIKLRIEKISDKWLQ